MAGTVRIDVTKVQNSGETLQTEAIKMKQALESIKDIVNNTKSYFQSSGGDETRRSFNESAAKFDSFKKFVDEYGEFLKSYGRGHEKLDQSISDAAKKFPKL